MNPAGLVLLASLLGLGAFGGKIGKKLDEVNKRNALKPTPTSPPQTSFRDSALGSVLGGYSRPTNTPMSSPTPNPTAIPSPMTIPTSTPRYGSLAGYTNGPIPSDFLPRINTNAQKYNIPPALLGSGLHQEGGFNPNARNQNKDGTWDVGAAQINQRWHPEIKEEQALNPDFATEFMAGELNRLYKLFGRWDWAIAAYNVGQGMVGPGNGRDESGLGPRGKGYVDKIKRNLDPSILQQLGL